MAPGIEDADDRSAPARTGDAHPARLSDLPAPYAAVIEGLAEGISDAELAERAGVDPSALPAFVRVAIAKLLDTDENA